MEKLLTPRTVSLTEFREPNKVIAKAGNQPIAILNHNELIGYFVPKSALVEMELEVASNDQLKAFLKNKLSNIKHVLNYLKSK